MTADFPKHDIGRSHKTGCLRLEGRGTEKPRFNPQRGSGGMHGGLICFEVERIDSGDRLRCDIACLEC